MNSTQKIALVALTGFALNVSTTAFADSIFRGVRGPTTEQLDIRVSDSERSLDGKTTRAVTENTILKYWDGKETGLFGYVAIPLKQISKAGTESSGLGDVSVGLCPRGTISLENGSIHYLTAAGVTVPTGDKDETPALGTGRFDQFANIGVTALSLDRSKEIDLGLVVTRASEDRDVNSDDFSGGIVAGGAVSKNVRLVGGVVGNYKSGGKSDGAYTAAGRVDLRYTLSPQQHIEAWVDKDVAEKNLPNGTAATLVYRLNF